MKKLQDAGLLEKMNVIVVSDHGIKDFPCLTFKVILLRNSVYNLRNGSDDNNISGQRYSQRNLD